MTSWGTPEHAWLSILAAADTLRNTFVNGLPLPRAICRSYYFFSFESGFSIIYSRYIL